MRDGAIWLPVGLNVSLRSTPILLPLSWFHPYAGRGSSSGRLCWQGSSVWSERGTHKP